MISSPLVRANILGSRFCRTHRRSGSIDRKNVDLYLPCCAAVVFVAVFLPCVSASQRAATRTNDMFTEKMYCPSYCTQSNKYSPGFYCDHYCCGNKNTRYCCANESLSIGDDYSDVCYACSSTPCGFFGEWSTILMSMAIVLSAGLITACFCHCYASGSGNFSCCCFKLCHLCRKRTSPEPTSQEAPPDDEQPSRRTRRHHRRHNGERRHGAERRHGSEVVEIPANISDFNPTHPFAFRPPDYDELSTTNSEPPKYDEIAMMTSSTLIDTVNNDGSNTNNAFENDDGDDVLPTTTTTTMMEITDYSTTGSGCVVRVDVRPIITVVDDDPLPPAYDVAVVTSTEIESTTNA